MQKIGTKLGLCNTRHEYVSDFGKHVTLFLGSNGTSTLARVPGTVQKIDEGDNNMWSV